MRLITRQDAPLATALIAAAVIVFHQPLRQVFDVARDLELRYHVDLVPALWLLISVFVFHAYQKQTRAKLEAHTAAAEAAQARHRSQELEHLMSFGQVLANALDQTTLQQALWKFLPMFAQNRPFWVLAYKNNRWEPLVNENRSAESLEQLAAHALAPNAVNGVYDEEQRELVLPLMAGGAPVGAIGIGNLPELSAQERKAWGAAGTLVAISVRNVQLFGDTREQSLRDALTGCFNRAHGVEMLNLEIRRAKRTSRPLSILMFDIDRFKSINDGLGHLSGDELLQRVGAQLNELLRSTDVRCRYGGDEFMIILPDTPLAGAELVAESIRGGLGRVTLTAANSTPISVSVGVAVAGPNDRTAEALIDRADKALYNSKRDGRNRVSVAPSTTLALVRPDAPEPLTAAAGA